MAQLVKLYDYISRYEWNLYRYSTQFIRLKREHWHQFEQHFRHEKNVEHFDRIDESSNRFPLFLWRNQFKKRAMQQENKEEKEEMVWGNQELKQLFLDRFFPFQLQWASSTVRDISVMDKKVYKDEVLFYFLQRFPDHYFVLYFPVLMVNGTAIDGEIILISPLGVEIIYILETEASAFFKMEDARYWSVHQGDKQTKILSPILALKRTEYVLQQLLDIEQLSFPIRKVVLSRTNHIVCKEMPYHTSIIGKRDYPDWFAKKRSLSSPLKSKQLKVTELLLTYCQSISIKRPEWEQDIESL